MNTGFSEVIGSWNTQAISLPRSACNSASEAFSRSRPSYSMTPERCALSGSRLRIDIAVTLLPEPDSPTSATVVCSGMSKLTPLTAGTSVIAPRSPKRKATFRSRMLSNIENPYSAPRSLGSSASRQASAISENAVTNNAMNAVAAASCHQ